MKRRICTLLLVLALLGTLIPAASAEGLYNFQRVNSYEAGRFVDVPAAEWFAPNVQSAYELNLVQGVSANQFDPYGNLTIAQSLALACRLHNIYYDGSGLFVQGNPWYQVYVDYAVAYGIIQPDTYPNYNAVATRTQFAAMLAASVPAEALEAINNVERIPDVSREDPCADSIYQLYDAGVLSGNDEYGTFMPQSNIRRSEVAAIVTRIADPNLRKIFVLSDKPVPAVGISLDQTTLSLTAGEDAKLKAVLTPVYATEPVVWTSSNPSVADVYNGAVSAYAEGTAVITAAAGQYKATCTVYVEGAPMVFSGSGSRVITGIDLAKGAYYVEYTHNGRANIIGDFWYGDSWVDCDLVINDIGVGSGRRLITGAMGGAVRNGTLEIVADGDWTVKIARVSGATSTTLSGAGDWVTGVFTAKTSQVVCNGTHDGEANFIVDVYELNGTRNSYQLAANEVGYSTSQRLIRLKPGTQYFIAVNADGNWTLDFGQGDPLEVVTPPVVSGGSDLGGLGGDYRGPISDYPDFYGVPDFGTFVGVAPWSELPGSYIYKSSDVYASAGSRAVEDYLELLADCGFTMRAGYSSTVIYKNDDLGWTVSVGTQTISTGEHINVKVY